MEVDHNLGRVPLKVNTDPDSEAVKVGVSREPALLVCCIHTLRWSSAI